MRLAKLEESLANISETLVLFRDNDMATNNVTCSIEVLQSIEEFEAEESKPQDKAYLQKKVVLNTYRRLLDSIIRSKLRFASY